MAEKVVLVCDVCGEPATESVSIRVNRRSLTKDVCGKHLSELTAGARPARPGRRKGTVGKAPSARGKATTRRRKTNRGKAGGSASGGAKAAS